MITYNTTRLKVVTRLEVVETKYVLGIHRPGNTASQGHANTQSVSITYYVPPWESISFELHALFVSYYIHIMVAIKLHP